MLLAARALIPDDDDEELIEKAKANRKNRLQTEKVAEKEYAKSGGFADSEVVAIQVWNLPSTPQIAFVHHPQPFMAENEYVKSGGFADSGVVAVPVSGSFYMPVPCCSCSHGENQRSIVLSELWPLNCTRG